MIQPMQFDVWAAYKALPPLDCPECQADLSYGEGRSGGYQYGPIVVIDCCPGCDTVTIALLDNENNLIAVYAASDNQFRAFIEGTPLPYTREESEYVRHQIRRGEVPYRNK